MSDMNRREMLGAAAVVGGWIALNHDLSPAAAQQSGSTPTAGADGPYALPPLPYDYADLEPHLDAQTMKLHHDMHHAAYVKGANAALADLEKIRREGGDSVQRIRTVTDALTFNTAGHVLHSMLWETMKKDGGGDPRPDSELGKLITRDFGSTEAFKAHLSAAAVQVQGSGWGLLCYEPMARRLVVLQVEKQQNLSIWGVVPLMGIDVWEHAYYLKFQNKRADYVKAFWNVVNWDAIDKRLGTALKLE